MVHQNHSAVQTQVPGNLETWFPVQTQVPAYLCFLLHFTSPLLIACLSDVSLQHQIQKQQSHIDSMFPLLCKEKSL